MGLIRAIAGNPATVSALGEAAAGVAEVFTPSATRRMELSAEAQMAALRQLGEEYGHPALGWFDRMVNGLNRLPRPMLAFGTLGLFVHAMVDPDSFGARMQGLNAIPEPLWWLLGAIVAFYFGARETHYFRTRPPAQAAVAAVAAPGARGADASAAVAAPAPRGADANAALEEWRAAATQPG